MNTIKQKLKTGLLAVMIMLCSVGMPVMASADDNSLAALNVQNGTVSPEFVYSTWEYYVTVEPGTEELYLEPVTSSGNASVTSITGTVLQDGQATVQVNTMSESGIPMTYTLYVTESAAAAETEATEPETQATEAPTEAPTEAVTEAPTEAAQPETDAVATNALQDQVTKLKSDSDLMIKIMYGLIALSVVLLFLIINLILKNRDLKDDLKDAEDQLAYQTNEFARKEKFMVTDNYYAPTQQGAVPQPSAEKKTEEKRVAEPVKEKSVPVQEEQPEAQPAKPEAVKEQEKPKDEVVEAEDKKDVNVTMVDL